MRADEVRAALALTRRTAESLTVLATDLVRRLPDVLAAMMAGDLDQARARVFADWTRDLCQRHALAVVAALLAHAPRLTTSELMIAVQKAAIELDPEWARRRYEKALATRRVENRLNPDGTATLSGHSLPADEVAAACDRLDALALRVKNAGHPATLPQIRADIFLGRNDRYIGLSDEQLFAHLVAMMASAESTVGDPPEGDDPPDERGGNGRGPDPEPGPVDGPSGGGWPAPEDSSDGFDEAAVAAVPDPAPAMRGRGLRLLVGLGTIAGLDPRPGELLGTGFLHADLARRVSAAPAASWFYALVRPDETPINVGPIRRRPTVSWHYGGTPTYDKVEVWLHLTPDELAALAAHPPPGWEQVITDLIHRVAQNPDGAPNGEPDDRLPSTMLRRWFAVRDRRCVFPGCRVAPHRCDIDHTIEHHKGGPTIDTNLGPCCRPDHRLHHDYGWAVEQIRPGHFIWTSPSGHEYERVPPPGPEQSLAPMAEPTVPGGSDRRTVRP